MSSQVGTLLGSSMPHGTQAAAGLRLRRMRPLIEIQSRPSASRSTRIASARCFFSMYSFHTAVGSQIWPSASITRFAIWFLPGNVLLMTQPIRIAVLNFAHETVTFLPNDTTLDDFVYEGSPAKGEALLAWEPRSYMGGFVKVAREHDGRRVGRHRIAAVAQDRHRLGLDHAGGLRALPRQDDRRAEGRR